MNISKNELVIIWLAEYIPHLRKVNTNVLHTNNSQRKMISKLTFASTQKYKIFDLETIYIIFNY